MRVGRPGAGYPDSVSSLFRGFRPDAARRCDREAARRADALRSTPALRSCHDHRLWAVWAGPVATCPRRLEASRAGVGGDQRQAPGGPGLRRPGVTAGQGVVAVGTSAPSPRTVAHARTRHDVTRPFWTYGSPAAKASAAAADGPRNRRTAPSTGSAGAPPRTRSPRRWAWAGVVAAGVGLLVARGSTRPEPDDHSVERAGEPLPPRHALTIRTNRQKAPARLGGDGLLRFVRGLSGGSETVACAAEPALVAAAATVSGGVTRAG
jgi:hypothetical protein